MAPPLHACKGTAIWTITMRSDSGKRLCRTQLQLPVQAGVGASMRLHTRNAAGCKSDLGSRALGGSESRRRKHVMSVRGAIRQGGRVGWGGVGCLGCGGAGRGGGSLPCRRSRGCTTPGFRPTIAQWTGSDAAALPAPARPPTKPAAKRHTFPFCNAMLVCKTVVIQTGFRGTQP